MKQLVQEGVDYWFYLSPKVYVTSKENIFLYHTESGARLEVTERHLKDLLQAVYEPKNLGVVEFPQELRDYIDFIERSVGVPIAIASVGPDREQTITLRPTLLPH